MPRSRRPAVGIGKVIDLRMEELGLTPQELAAAARLHKGTIYCILDGRTARPRPATLRAIAKVLRISVGRLVGSEQLELIEEPDDSFPHPLEGFLLEELARFDRPQRIQAARVAIFALVDTLLGMGRAIGADLHEQAAASTEPRPDDPEAFPASLLREQFRRLPPIARKPGAQAAIGAMVDLRLAQGSEPSPALYHRLYAASRSTRRSSTRR